MATSIQMKNETNGLTKEGFYGYSWTTLFFGPFVPLFRADFVTFLGYVTIVFLISLITVGIGGLLCFIIWSFFYNSFYTKKLLERGYKFNGSVEENTLASNALGIAVATTQFFDSETDISNEKYKLYLVTKFEITKNDVLEKFIVRGEIFNTLDDALIYSKNIDYKDFADAILLNKNINDTNSDYPEHVAKTGVMGPGNMYKFVEYRSGRVKVSHTSGFNKVFASMTEAKDYIAYS